MYIRKVDKTSGSKKYSYYRLVHGYKVGNKVRQQILLNLGKLEDVEPSDHKLLADRIESILTGADSLFEADYSKIESQAQKFALEIQSKGLFSHNQNRSSVGKEVAQKFTEVNLESIENEECLEIGGEWFIKQIFDCLHFDKALKDLNFSEFESSISQLLLTTKMLHPSSELESERWLQNNSGASELYGLEPYQLTRYRLYQAGTLLYQNKDQIEKSLYTEVTNIFSNRNKILIYDLTNMYFEGSMQNSTNCKFGRSKQKRSDCKLVGLALAIDGNGFIRHNKIYPGNVSEPSTLTTMLESLKGLYTVGDEKPVVIMDAGIATNENLTLIKSFKFDYVCVSRSKVKNYEKIGEASKVKDNKDNEIYLTRVSNSDSDDCIIHVKSTKKEQKEKSIKENLENKFIEKLKLLKDGLEKPRCLKSITSIHEAVGKLKNKYTRISSFYKITYIEDKKSEKILDIIWEVIPDKQHSDGEYFIRYSRQNITENEVWDIYNTIRSVESTFRCLKTDLNIRPIYHQNDEFINIHIWLSIIAYQFVNYARYRLKENGINDSWTKIVNKLCTQKITLISMMSKNNEKIYTKLCTKPREDSKLIYSALGFKERPYVRKTKVVTQL